MKEKKKKVAISLNLDWPLKRYHDIYSGIQKYNNEFTNWNLVWDHYPEIYLKKSKSKSYYDGIIGRIKYDAYYEAQRLKVPVVNTWLSSSLVDKMPSVLDDYKEAGRMAAAHLVKRGFRNFALIDHRASRGAKAFYAGFSEEVKPVSGFFKRYLFNRSCDESLDLWEKFHNDFAGWIKDWQFPIGIGCSLSSIGPKITTRLAEHGILIPDQASVISSGNDLMYCEGHSPQLSSINMDYFKTGYESARMLHQLMEGKDLDEVQKIIPPINVVARESTDTYAVEDPVVKLALRYIADNFEKNIQVIDVVEAVPVARRSLEVRFNKNIGHTIIDEINRNQVSTLKRLLLETEIGINSLYGKVGFSCPQHMRRVFKKITNMTPGEFRSKMANLS